MKYSIPTESLYSEQMRLAFELRQAAEEAFPTFPENITLIYGEPDRVLHYSMLKQQSPRTHQLFDQLLPKLNYELFPPTTTVSGILDGLVNLNTEAVELCVQKLHEAVKLGFHDLFGDDAATFGWIRAQRFRDLWTALKSSVAAVTANHFLVQEHLELFVSLYEPYLPDATARERLLFYSDARGEVHESLKPLLAHHSAYFATGAAEGLTAYYEESERLRDAGEVISQENSYMLPAKEKELRERFSALEERLAVQSLAPEVLS